MRRSKTIAAALVAAGAAALPLGIAVAGAAPAQDPLTASACGTLGVLTQPVCELVSEVEGLLDPTDPVVEPVVEAVQPVLDGLEPVTEAAAPVTEAVSEVAPSPVAPTAPGEPAPAPAPSPTPGPEGSGAPGGSATATSSGAPTGFSAPLRTSVDGFGTSRVPAVPSGFSLQLSPLGVPTLSIGSDFAAPALDADLPLPEAGPFEPVIEAVTAGAASSSDDSKAT
ncbi:MAG: hypothetical protein ACLGI8_05845, partial [Acidimicrobiia bacterium]